MVKNANKKNRFGSRRRDSHKSRDDDSSESDESRESSESSESSSESSESDIDEETIQKALARRLMSDSKQLEIDETNIPDSEMEDVISSVRRLRYIYRVIDRLSKRVEELEEAIKPSKHDDEKEK